MLDLNVLVFDINRSDEDDKQVEKLNSLLGLFGGKAEINKSFDRDRLILSYDEEKLEKWKTRNAGRVSNYYNLSVADVRAKIKLIGSEAAAKELGMTRQGMYKRLRKADQEGSDRF